ncbi:T9SS type A sorting domain-containing protein [Gracilimonas sp.]|uniref:T9SS type A sorting domain-containing protein n=1 Tax=Gracilimonas sp. TaxID=1974203 RepID=UPI0028716789|nr:T9SS type A sorting domain-containing protein [Gracilimonas sp.]
MHKALQQIKRGILPITVLVLFAPLTIVAQVQTEPVKILDVQDAFLRGELDVESAALKQFELLHDDPSSLTKGKNIQKCATPAYMFYYQHKDQLSPQTLEKIEGYISRDDLSEISLSQETYISPSGKFKINYETSGSNAVPSDDNDNNGVPDYVERVAESADSSYRHTVITLGFPDPIPTNKLYRIDLKNSIYYGQTVPSSSEPSGSYINLENDFVGFPENSHPDGDQIGAIYATMAHEFKHAIQYVQNNRQGPTHRISWSEMDATLMEEVVYDNVNDYYHYLKTSFDSDTPDSRSIFYDPTDGTPGAYYHVSWMIFYAEYFGAEIWQEVWEQVEIENELSIDDALRRILPSKGTSFGNTFVQNHLWHYASGPRAGNDTYGFGEKESYPYANIEDTLSGLPQDGVRITMIQDLAAHYFEVIPSPSDDGFVNIAVDFDTTQIGLGMVLYLKNGEIEAYFDSGEDKPQVYIPTEIRWKDVDSLGVVVANHSKDATVYNLKLQFGSSSNKIEIRDPKYNYVPDNISVYQNYPNPFNLSTTIQFDLTTASDIELTVYDITGRKVQTLANGVYQLGEQRIPFDASGLSSGVYFYRLQINNQVYTKKMTLIK